MDDGFLTNEFHLTKIIVIAQTTDEAEEIKQIADKIPYIRNVAISERYPRFFKNKDKIINRDGRYVTLNEMSSAQFKNTYRR